MQQRANGLLQLLRRIGCFLAIQSIKSFLPPVPFGMAFLPLPPLRLADFLKFRLLLGRQNSLNLLAHNPRFLARMRRD